MLAASAAPHQAEARARISPETARRAALWLVVFSGSLTLFEPAPYEFLGLAAIVLWSAGGLKAPREMVPILILVLAYMCGALVTLTLVIDKPDTVIWTAVGWYLALTGLFYMMALVDHTAERLDVIVRAYVATAVICAAIGVLGWSGVLPGEETFTLYGRAKSTFEDPNVFGPFLIFPAVVLVQRLYIEGRSRSLPTIAMLVVIVSGLFLSFSRGAWGHFAASVAVMTVATLVCARSPRLKVRVAMFAVAGLVGVILLVLLLLSFPPVRDLFLERASLEQSYDMGEFGRFNRHWLGFVLALDHPFGIGMLQFGPMFGEDTHNTYLNAFMAYGWIGGVSWIVIVALTLVVGWRACLRPSPWRHIFICVMATYSVMIVEAWIIDIDHWRHAWLLFGVAWGLTIATLRSGHERGHAGAEASALP